MKGARIAACGCALAVALAACGEQDPAPGGAPARLPASGVEYRALGQTQRTAVAESCRDRAATGARGLAARQLRAVDAAALREELDGAYTVIARQRTPVATVCAEVLPFVTPGLRVSLEGTKDLHDGTFTTQTTSDKMLRIRGRVSPAATRGRVVARRDVGPTVRRRAAIGPDGRFALPAVGLRKVADNTFTLTIDAPPNAPRKVLLSVICLDCLAGAPAPSRG